MHWLFITPSPSTHFVIPKTYSLSLSLLYSLSSNFSFYLYTFHPALDSSVLAFCSSIPPEQALERSMLHFNVSCCGSVSYILFFICWYYYSCILVAFSSLACRWTDKVNCSNWRWLKKQLLKKLAVPQDSSNSVNCWTVYQSFNSLQFKHRNKQKTVFIGHCTELIRI